jgi:Ala-tRNA(Pro) deacylase
MNDKENRVQLLMDEDILKGEYFGCHPCINTTSLRIKTKDLTEKILPAMGHSPIVVHLD